MGIEQKINYQLNKYPGIKKIIKRLYQSFFVGISHQSKYKGNITRISPEGGEYFFGYYDKSPWDATDRYMLCMKAKDTWSDVSPRDKAEIILIDTHKDAKEEGRIRKLAETSTWNVQQGCMLQWLGPDFSEKIIYNDFREGQYVSIILNIRTLEERVIDAPIYSVSEDGRIALTLDFSRLYNLRPGYGYYNVPENSRKVPLPNSEAIWSVDLYSGEVSGLLSYKDFANFQTREEMQGEDVIHKVNHIMLNPSGKRFAVLYRWFVGQRKYTRLITCNIDGSEMYLLSDDDMVSHYYWQDDNRILAFENKNGEGTGYYLMTDKTNEYIHCWKQFTNDGHPSYNPQRSLVVTDSYPDRTRMSSINIMKSGLADQTNRTIAKVYSPFKYDNDTRCDLHPRWNRKGDEICFDSVFEGYRGLYVVGVNDD